ncbi:MAG: dephospho-CoA kinase [Actinomycetota bacterium]|nr:dephospho-CoA kinase [Actinomycetota bacterium]
MGHRDTRDSHTEHRGALGSFAPLLLGGGIGAGKSKVLAEFLRAGFVVIETDTIGHEVLDARTESGRLVMARWPEAVVAGSVDRAKLAGIVFRHPSALAELEAISHPAIWSRVEARVAAAAQDSPGSRVIVEIPLLRLHATSPWLKVAVLAPEDVRIARAVARGADVADVVARIANQEPDEAWAEWADVVIDNEGEWASTLQAIERLVSGVAP